MKQAGFEKEVKAVEQGVCPICNKPPTGFRDKLSAREFEISGMCQVCQDRIFGGEPE